MRRCSIIIALVALSGCEAPLPPPRSAPRPPGTFEIAGFWQGGEAAYRNAQATRYFAGENQGKATVGLPYSIDAVIFCEGGDVNANAEIATGALPPGLQFVGKLSITGVPTLAGDWSFTVRYSNITCAGHQAPDQTIAVHVIVTGSSLPGG